MIVSHWLHQFRRQGVIIEECLWLRGEPYFSGKAIGKWLDYSHPEKAIKIIISRHPFIKQYSKNMQVLVEENNPRGINLTPGENQKSPQKTRRVTREVRFFSLVGLVLLAFHANTPNAKDFQIAAARLVEAFLKGKLVERTPDEVAAEQILASSFESPPGEKELTMYKYAEMMGCSITTAYRHKKIIERGESPFDKKYRNAIKMIISGKLELEIRDIFYQDPNTPPIVIWRAIGCPEKPSYTTLKKFVRILKQERAGDPQAEAEVEQ